MSLRAYLIFSYLGLVALLTIGMVVGADLVSDRLKKQNMVFAEVGIEQVTQANMQISQKILTAYGEFIVEDFAADKAALLSRMLGGKKTYDYHQMRRDSNLRRLATSEVRTPEGVAGYTDLLDKMGVAVLHPNPQVEGKNFCLWAEEFPEMWRLVTQAFTEPKVKGYYTFIDEHNQKRQKFMVLVQVPRTPFILVAVVNIDEFFLPVHDKINRARQEVVSRAQQAIVDNADRMANRAKMASLLGGMIFCLVGALFGLRFSEAISRPLVRLRDGVEEIGEGNFSVTVPARGAREVRDLARSFNRLGDQLTDYIAKRDFIRDTFGRYVTKEVVQKLLESREALALGGEIRDVSILMSDLRGFTALTSTMAPEQVITFLNRYLGKMIEILLDHRAIIDEIIGDGILAFFGAPDPLEDHPQRALECALKMQLAMEEVNAHNLADGLPHLEMGIAVNSGTVVVGNIGSELRAKYSVIGAPVNIAGRIESFSLGGQVLISHDTYLRVQPLVEVGEILQVQMKGVPGFTTLYDIRGLRGPYQLRLKPRLDKSVELPEKLNLHVYRLSNKIVIGTISQAAILRLSETGADILYEGELVEWEDVRLQLLDAHRAELPGRIYAKVMKVRPKEAGWYEAQVRFTSVSPEMLRIIQEAIGSRGQGGRQEGRGEG